MRGGRVAVLAAVGLAIILVIKWWDKDEAEPVGFPEPEAGADAQQPRTPSQRARTPFVTVSGPDLEQAVSVLTKVVDEHASDPGNPWAIAHGVLARGEAFTVDGEPAVPFLYENYAEVQQIGDDKLVAFPRKNDAGVEIEPHTDLVLKAITEVGVDPHTVVHVSGEEFEVADTWRHSLATTYLDKSTGDSSYDSPNDMPWGVQALALWAPPDLRWKSFTGTEMTMDDLAKLMVHVLTKESDFMIRSMMAGEDFEKRRQGVLAYTCGGAHLLQGSIAVVAGGFGGTDEREKMRVQGQLSFYRFPVEIGIYDKAMQEHPEHRLVLMSQQLKFTGHWLESVHKLMAAGLYEPNAIEQQTLSTAIDVLISTTKELKALGAFDNLEQIDTENHQLYLDLVGDSAHAIRGVELATGRQEFLY
ncbi:MAG TPA: hypothetical protein QGF58_30915 [Myxococcota bacterium]|nr:hypothetical protein [Myxococcota bacterium]